MRQQEVTMSAAGSSPWIFVNDRSPTDQHIGFQTVLGFGTTLTYDVQYSIDANTQDRQQNIAVVTSSETSTVTITNHGLKTGDNIIVFDSGYVNHSPDTGVEGSFDVTSTNLNTFTYASPGAIDGTIKARMISFVVSDHPTVNGETTLQKSNFTPTASTSTGVISACRLNVSAYTDGFVTLKVLQNG